MFSFPPLPAGEPSTRNWYQELLDHPDCQGDTYKVSEAYESFRQNSLAKSISIMLPTTDDDEDVIRSAPPPVLPDQVLIQHLKRQQANGSEIRDPLVPDPLDTQEVNCEGIWARPSSKITSFITDIQDRLHSLLGSDIHLIPTSDLHLSILELSHRHTVAHLRTVYAFLGPDLITSMLNLPHICSSASSSSSSSSSSSPSFPAPATTSAPRLIRPMLLFDQRGLALSFVPATGHAPYKTYHHLRAALQACALSTGLSIDTCYTAPTAHITLGRFVGTAAFFGAQKAGVARMQFVAEVRRINAELREWWGREDEGGWVVGGESGLECQLGYLKFGRGAEHAEAVGRPAGQEGRGCQGGESGVE